MPSALEDFANLASAIQSVVTPVALVVGGVWAYRRYILEASNYPHIETSAEIKFIGRQDDFWIVELCAILNNKGKVQHKINKFGFDLNALFSTDAVEIKKKWGGQVHFPNEVAKGSFIPDDFEYFVVGPTVSAKYSYVARVPAKATFLILHCNFTYADDRGFSHTMETTAQVPVVEAD